MTERERDPTEYGEYQYRHDIKRNQGKGGRMGKKQKTNKCLTDCKDMIREATD